MPPGFRCGDLVFRDGQLFGVAHRWVGDGVSVDLAHDQRIGTDLDLPTDAVIVTWDRFESGEFTFAAR